MGHRGAKIVEKGPRSLISYNTKVDNWARGREVVVPVPAVSTYLNRLAKGRSVHHLSRADVQADVVHVAGRAVEDQVARQQRLPGRDARARVELCLGRARQGDPGSGVGRLGQS